MDIRKRVCDIVTDKEHTSEEDILEGFSVFEGSILNKFYILHDKDTFTSKEVEKMKEKGFDTIPEEGDFKGPHWHILLRFRDAKYFSTIAKAFKVSPNFINDTVKGYRGRKAEKQFFFMLRYLTHSGENAISEGKYQYKPEEVRGDDNYIELLEEYSEKYSEDKETSEKPSAVSKRMASYRVPLLQGEMKPKQILEQDPEVYAKYFPEIDNIHAEYLKTVPPPKARTCVFITGEGGVGKDSLAKALAHALYMDLSEDECVYPSGTSKCAFDNYRQQPTILWSELRANTFLEYFGGRGDVFNLFDSHPRHQAFNVKYSSVYLNHEVGFITTQDKYESFRDAMTKGADNNSGVEDVKQVYRRFPIWITLKDGVAEVSYSCGAVDTSKSYDEVDRISLKLCTSLFGQIKENQPKDYERLCKEKLKPVVDIIKKCLKPDTGAEYIDIDALCSGPIEFNIPEEFKQEQLPFDSSISSERRKVNA